MAVPFGPQILFFLFFLYVKRQLNEWFAIDIAEHFLIKTMRMSHRFLTEGQRRQNGLFAKKS